MKRKGAAVLTKEEFARRAQDIEGKMYRVACAYLKEEQDRLDAAQEALLKAWKGRGRLKHPEYFDTWLIRILIRECVNIQRHQKRMTPVERLPEKAAEPEEGRPVREAILALKENQRLPVVLFYMEGYTVEEIARTLRLPKGTVCSRLARAREQMKQYLTKEAE